MEVVYILVWGVPVIKSQGSEGSKTKNADGLNWKPPRAVGVRTRALRYRRSRVPYGRDLSLGAGNSFLSCALFFFLFITKHMFKPRDS